ncbi:U-box domain-containing protein 33 [Hordeum vulgare]|nr:U-box domain-containing protein 33 [Hordeum vulgare]
MEHVSVGSWDSVPTESVPSSCREEASSDSSSSFELPIDDVFTIHEKLHPCHDDQPKKTEDVPKQEEDIAKAKEDIPLSMEELKLSEETRTMGPGLDFAWCSEFSLSELRQATRNFSEATKVGEGVYRGVLRNTTVAIKMLHSHSSSQFQQE